MSDLGDIAHRAITESVEVKRRLADELPMLIEIAQRLQRVLRSGGTVYLCGNGGSAAEAQHVATELVGRYLRDRRALPAIALTTDTSILTAVANDYGFEHVFAKQVRALAGPGDAVVGISTSGESANVVAALAAAKEMGSAAIGFTGEAGGRVAKVADVCLRVPSTSTPRIQEAQLLIWHIVCEFIELGVVEEEGTQREQPR